MVLIHIYLQVEKIITIMTNPRQYKIPDWFLNRQKDIVDGKYSQVRVALLIDCFLVEKLCQKNFSL